MKTIGSITLNKKYFTGDDIDEECYLIVREDADRYYVMDGLERDHNPYVIFPRPMFEVRKLYSSDAVAAQLLRLFLKLHGCKAFRSRS